jgi:hypothetical protein
MLTFYVRIGVKRTPTPPLRYGVAAKTKWAFPLNSENGGEKKEKKQRPF